MLIYPLEPWVSWADTHSTISQVFVLPQAILQAQPGAKTTLELNRWSVPACAFCFFVYFGLSGEAVGRYRALIWRVVEVFGVRPKKTRARRQTTTSTKRLVNGTVTSSQDVITFPSAVHTGFNASRSSFCPSILVDDESEFRIVQEPLQASIKDLESQT
ncbi:a-factor receptor [Ceratobasidium sp. UAMH 11750]|nr:a-factor receptor [Ceratobasidium sp. UAMH 11750]